MSDLDDLDTYGQPNDLDVVGQAPREPQGESDQTTADYEVWKFDSDTSDYVPDTFVVARDPEPLDFRMWVFTAVNNVSKFTMRASHKYSPEEQRRHAHDDCCEVLLDGHSLAAEHCPEEVAELVTLVTGSQVIYPGNELDPDRGRGEDGPISY
ncbi:hypothetical protein ACFQGT_07755 [Natrialbaceae archaeon GCM10025810]|uniref:hypothetical protein n=1 Tax=Halovalidus salilacus TaxID=3075124 RepID=UPI00361039F4